MTLKEQINLDIDTFLNKDEFAIVATFDGVEINVLYDKIADDNSIFEVINCKVVDAIGISTASIFNINGVNYTPSSWIPTNGILEVILNVQK